MAHFAELDSNNKVLRVVVGCNQDVAANGGDQSEQAAKHFETTVPLSSNGVKWIQTSYNSNFRGIYAGKNCIYIPEIDKFISAKPYASWTLDSNYVWQPPIAKPTDASKDAVWDEVNQYWLDYDENNNLIQI